MRLCTRRTALDVKPDDRVYLMLGSMTEASTTGSNEASPAAPDSEGVAWNLWRKLAQHHSGFGNPGVFCGTPEKTTWESFTVTTTSRKFIDFMEQFTGNVTGTGGLVTFADSGCVLS